MFDLGRRHGIEARVRGHTLEEAQDCGVYGLKFLQGVASAYYE